MDNDRRQSRDDKLDEALEETFPASDPPANTVETGIGIAGAMTSDETVTDNREASRFELVKNGQVAFLKYERKADALVFMHTEVPPSLRGHHIGDVLVKSGLETARAQGLRIVVICPFVRARLREHPELRDSR